jgi:hypothetical protein
MFIRITALPAVGALLCALLSTTMSHVWAIPASSSSHKFASRERKPTQRALPPKSVDQSEEDPSRWTASWGDSAKIHFSIKGEGEVGISWIQKSDQPEYTGGQMIADALRKANISRPQKISMTNITHRTTVVQLRDGVPASRTALGGTTLRNAAEELGARVESWESETGPHPKISARLSYLDTAES